MLQQVNELLRRPSDTEKLNEKTETGWRDVNIQSPIFLLFSYSAGVSEDDENDLYQKFVVKGNITRLSLLSMLFVE